MTRDVETLRGLLLTLEEAQRSPPESFLLDIADLARDFGRSSPEICAALDFLVEHDFIEGPGAYRDSWLFRKITPRGAALIGRIRDARDWRRVKDAYGSLLDP